MKIKYDLVTSVVLSLALLACNKSGKLTEKQSEKIIKKATKFERIAPSRVLTVGCQSDVFDASKGAQINYESGAKVIVPEDAFVDEDGNPVTGEVKLDFSEINDPASVIASGLPMCIDVDGKTGHFESGGMFEINANQQGKKLKLAPGKKIEVQTMSNKPGDFDFYTFNAEEGKWVEQSKAELNAVSSPNPTLNSPIATASFTTSAEAPPKPEKASSEDVVFDLKISNTEAYGIPSFSQKMWKFTDQEGAKNGKYDILFKKRWDDVSITNYSQQTAVYTVTATRKELTKKRKNGEHEYKTVKEKVTITPVLMGEDYEEALAEYQKDVAKYQKRLSKAELASKMQEVQAKFVRAVNITSLGVHNWDRILKQKNVLVLNAEYSVPGMYEDEDLPIVYMIPGDKKEVITFYQSSMGNFAFNPKYQNTLLVIMPNNEIASLKTKRLSPAVINNAKHTNEISLKLEPTGVFVNSTKDLSKFIQANS